jgi:cytoskeletal protein RodZ
VPEIDSEATFQAIGQELHAQRESLGLSLDEVAQFTHLRIPYLKAMESGEIDALPSPVQGRGMLKNYAGFLGLDADQMLLRFAEGLQARLVERTSIDEKQPSREAPTPARRPSRWLSRDLVVGIIMALSLVVFIIWGAVQVTAIRSEGNVEPTAPAIADVLLPSSTATLFPTHTATSASPVEGNSESSGIVEEPVVEETQAVVFVSERVEGAVQVQIVARQRAWMRITVDGEVEFDGRITPGTIYGFAGEEYVEITTGNGAGLQVFYNEQDLGTLGAIGEVINFVITINGVQTPTPTITLTPTSTATPEETPTPTP